MFDTRIEKKNEYPTPGRCQMKYAFGEGGERQAGKELFIKLQ
jgi:hypothetical protein